MPVASGTANQALPSVRAQAAGPSDGLGVVPQPQRGLQAAQPPAGALQRAVVAAGALEREHGHRGQLVDGDVTGRVAQRAGAHEREPVAERHLVGLDHEPLDRGDHDRQRAAAVGGGLQLGVGDREALRLEA